jgi:hypothetical protein
VNYLSSKIKAEEFKANYKVNQKDFTRDRTLSFSLVTVFILTGIKMSLGNRIRKFFKSLGDVKNLVAPSSIYKARKKIKYELYKRLTKETVYIYYHRNKYVKRWRNRLLWAVDGSSINLPNSEETRAYYSKATNQTSTVQIQGLGTFLYDVLNEVIINAELTEKKYEVDVVLDTVTQHYAEDAIIIYDRGYANYSLIATHCYQSRDYLIRLPSSQTFPAVCNFIESNETDQLVRISVSKKQKKYVEENNLPTQVEVRLIKVTLSTGETEILITSLLDKELYPYDDFHDLYFQRWGVETCIGRLKNLLDIQRFSSGFDLEILQDFHAIVFLSSLESVITKEDEEVISSKDSSNKYEYKINKAISYAEVSDSIVELLLQTQRPIEDIFEDIEHIVKINLTPIRPNRSFPRNKSSTAHGLNFHKYGKKLFT